MAEFSYIRHRKCGQDKVAYINNDLILEFGESSVSKVGGEKIIESHITMVDGTTYYFHKSLADLMSEFGKIQYTV